MTNQYSQSLSAARKHGVALIMIACLAVSVAGAWWYTYSVQSGAEAGAKIVSQIHDEGLGKFWTPPPNEWRLISVKGQVTGWQATLRRQTQDGGYAGLVVRVPRAGSRIEGDWKTWELSADAAHGQYEAGTIAPLEPTTRIDYDSGTVTAVQTVTAQQSNGYKIRSRRQSSAKAPDNYMPEGTLPLARLLVARQETSGTFSMIVNSLPPAGKETRFTQVKISYVGRSESKAHKGAKQVQMTVGSGKELITLDDRGRVRELQAVDVTETASDRQSVVEKFPNAKRIVQVLGAHAGFSSGQAPASQPPSGVIITPSTGSGI